MAGVSNGTVFRVPKHENFTIMSNVHLRDKNLSWKARGLMSTILSFSPEWDYTLAGLAKCAKDSIASTRTGILELEENGYLHRDQPRQSDGTWAKMEFHVYEDPAQNPYFNNVTNVEISGARQLKDETNVLLKDNTFENDVDTSSHPECDFPISDNPITENPISENPISENQTQLNTYVIKYSRDQKLNPSINPRTGVETVESVETPKDGWMDRSAQLPNGWVETLTAIGYQFPCTSPASDQELLADIRQYGLDVLSAASLKACRIPYSFAQSKPVTEQALRLVACFEHYRSDDPFDPMIGILSALASMATTETAQYNKRTVRAEQVIDKINERIAADGCLMDWLLSFQEHWEKIMEERGDTITHRAAYLKSCLWKWLEDSDAETLTKIQAV